LTFHWLVGSTTKLVIGKDVLGLYVAVAKGCSFGHGYVFLSFFVFLVGPTEREVQDNLKEPFRNAID
jgi:hypothetical protein